MADWPGLAAAVSRGRQAMISVLATEGSAPRGAGTRMLVSADSQAGTIGGGRLEYEACAQARAILSLPPGAWRIQDYPLGPLLGQCCGGRVRLLIEHLDPARSDWLAALSTPGVLVSRLTDGTIERTLGDPDAAVVPPSARGERPVAGATLVERIGTVTRPVLLFGAGHVGGAIARTLRPLPFALGWFDSRKELAAIDGVTIVAADALPGCLVGAGADAAVLILTHDHALDYALVAAALGSRAGFVGLIGSATKRARFIGRLAAEGIDAARLTCPIGAAGIAGKEPDVIAIAVAAQLLALR